MQCDSQYTKAEPREEELPERRGETRDEGHGAPQDQTDS